MKKRLLTIVGMIILAMTSANAQKITEGDKKLSFLSGETKFKIQYVYDDMMVGKITEEEYRKKRVSEMNAKQKGKGDRWEKNWVDARSSKYQPMFEELVSKQFFKSGTGATASPDETEAKYTIVIRTIMTEPGFNVVAMKKAPFCNFEISWVETATGTVMAKGVLNKIPGILVGGSDFDFDPTNGIKESYAKAGKVIAKTMLKAMKVKKK